MASQERIEVFIATASLIAAQLIELNALREKVLEMEAANSTSSRSFKNQTRQR
jgi:hypothetical protein